LPDGCRLAVQLARGRRKSSEHPLRPTTDFMSHFNLVELSGRSAAKISLYENQK
jgi:hypothetical protein